MTSQRFSFNQLAAVLTPAALSFFDAGREYVVQQLDARELLRPARFDLGAKLLLAESILQGRDLTFAEDLYKSHLAVWNGFFEAAPPKFGPNDYLSSFRELAHHAGDLDFDAALFPVDRDFTLIDGAHRVALAAVTGKRVRIVKSERAANSYDQHFFEEMAQVLPERDRGFLIDQMGLQLVRFLPNCRCILVFPSTKNAHLTEVEALISQQARIFCQKRLKPTQSFLNQLIVHLYWNDKSGWIGSFGDGFFGACDKAARCYSPEGDLICYFVDGLSDQGAIELKREIRALYGISNDSCHISDWHVEAVRVAGMLLGCGEQLLTRIGVPREYIKFAAAFSRLQRFISDAGLRSDQFCVVGSALLALFGCRDTGDLDLVLDRRLGDLALPDGIENNVSQQAFYPVHSDLLINDPRYYFEFLGVRFARPEVILQFKQTRAQVPKDLQDVVALLKVFPDLDLSLRSCLSAESLSAASGSVLERTIRNQERIIASYSEAMQNWYIPQVERLEKSLVVANQALELRTEELNLLKGQLSLLERAVQRNARAGGGN